MNVSLVNGGKGEFTVLVDGREVTGKGDSLPDVSEVMDAEAVGMVRTMMTDDHKASSIAFVEKRQPVFKGR